MPQQKYTQEGLPIVLEDTMNIFIRDLEKTANEDNDSFGELCKKLTDNVNNENPNLEIINTYSKQKVCFSQEEFESFVIGFCFAYNLLRNQLEINKMEEVY